MSKSQREKDKDSTGTPNYVMVSVLFALIVFALEGLKESIGFGQDHSSLRLINLAFIGLGLALCFFWRRFPEGALKQGTALVYTLGLWLFLFLMAMGPLLFKADEAKLLFVHQIGYIGLLLSGLGLLANLFYETRLVPSLMLATIAGLLTSLGSIWGLVPSGAPHSPQAGLAQQQAEEGVIRSSEFAAQGEDHADGHAPSPSGPTASGHGDHETQDHQQQAAHEFEAEENEAHREHGTHAGEGTTAESGDSHEPDQAHGGALSAIKQKARAKARWAAAQAQAERNKIKPKGSLAARSAPIPDASHHKTAGHGAPAEKALPAAHGKAPTSQHAAAHPAAHWEYVGARGADAWGQLDKAYELCATGQEQSPIDIPTQWPLMQDVQLQYRLSSFEVVDNGHTVQYNVEAGNFMSLGSKRYELKQIHFHTPSEHFIGGRSSILEAHFVHVSASGELAVLGSMIEAGIMHREYQKLWEFMPFTKNTPVKPRGKGFDPRELLPRDLSVFRYAGSLTTPPCSEKVTWSVLRETVQLSQEQINRFRTKYRNNARPIQPLNKRH